MNRDGSSFALAIVGTGRARGQIAISCCPGRACATPLPSYAARLLERDVATIARWGAEASVSLLDELELARLRVKALPNLLAASRVAWHQVPLHPQQLPDPAFEHAWRALAPQLIRILWRGGRIAVHCRGRQGTRRRSRGPPAGGSGMRTPRCHQPRAGGTPGRTRESRAGGVRAGAVLSGPPGRRTRRAGARRPGGVRSGVGRSRAHLPPHLGRQLIGSARQAWGRGVARRRPSPCHAATRPRSSSRRAAPARSQAKRRRNRGRHHPNPLAARPSARGCPGSLSPIPRSPGF